ncbi:hypothetical protein RDWZM_010539, partial [Blomia tropicalis]
FFFIIIIIFTIATQRSIIAIANQSIVYQRLTNNNGDGNGNGNDDDDENNWN